MKTGVVLAWRLNKRLIELDDETTGQTIGVVRRSGKISYFRWLGFVDSTVAKGMRDARPVKLVVARVGWQNGFETKWDDLEESSFVQGCLVEDGVYAILTTKVRLV